VRVSCLLPPLAALLAPCPPQINIIYSGKSRVFPPTTDLNTSPFGRMNYKDTKPYMSAFLKIDLLTDFAALCLTDFIDWRYIHSVVCIFDPACELLPPWTKELYLCTVASLLYLLSDLIPPFLMYSIWRQCVTVRERLGWGDVELCCRPYSEGVLHSVSDQIQNLKIATLPQTK
jgi:hypothetical protein